MRRPSLTPIAGITLAILGAALVLVYVRGVETDARAATDSVPAYVATQSVPAGTAGADVGRTAKRTQVPRDLAPADAVTNPGALAGQLTLGGIDDGDVLRARDFGTSETTKGDLAIPAGKEAVAVAVSLDGGVAQFPAPGDHVNVYATFRSGQGVTKRILSDIQVLATEPRSSSGARGFGAAGTANLIYLLAVTPDEAGRLVFGKELGSIYLTLVPEGHVSPPVGDVTISIPGGLEAAPAAGANDGGRR